MTQKLLIAAGLIVFGVAGRLLPHMPNATPINTVSATAAQHLGRAWAVSIPLVAMALSDAFIGWYDYKILASVYASFALIGLISFYVNKLSGCVKWGFLFFLPAIIFFVTTNFTVWLFSPWYEKSLAGLLYCYWLGLPFLRNMAIGDVAYGVLILGFIVSIPVLKRYASTATSFQALPVPY